MDDVPTTHKEVKDLVESAPTPEQIKAATVVPIVIQPQEPPDPFRVKFLKWLSATMFLFILLLSQVNAYRGNSNLSDGNDSLREQLAFNSGKAECRARIEGEMLLAKAEGIVAGNTYNAVLGSILVGALDRTNTEERLAEFRIQLTNATEDLRLAAEHIATAAEKQRVIVENCQGN